MARGLGHGKKSFRYHLNSYGRLKLMTCGNTCRGQIFYRKNESVKKMTGCCIKRFFVASEVVNLSLDVGPSRKALKVL